MPFPLCKNLQSDSSYCYKIANCKAAYKMVRNSLQGIRCYRFRMEVNTPKKLVNGDLRSYICGSTPPDKEKIKVFGKTAHDLPKLINSALSLDVNVYSENDLFVCTNPCYKRLLS